MKSPFFKRSFGLLLATLLFTAGCGEKNPESYTGPIPNWSDVAVPETTTFEQESVVSGVENHFFQVEGWTEGELFAFLEEAMEVNGWQLNASNSEIRQFIKNEDVVTYNSNGESEGALHFVVIIEPAGVYGEN